MPMTPLIVALALLAVAVPVLLVRAAGAYLATAAGSSPAGRVRAAAADLSRTLGPVPAAALALLAGAGAVVAVCWPLGEALSGLEGAVDRPVFAYVQGHQNAAWHSVNA